MHTQRGGTLLGLIIGLIIGLAIAVVVAVTITKTSLPFTSKTPKAERTAEQNAGQITDPNKPLYGNKDAVKEAAKQFAKPDAPTALDEDKNNLSQAIKPKIDDKSDGRTDSKTADDKALGSKTADNKSSIASDAASQGDATKNLPAKADNADQKWTYFLQAGAFRERTDAENTRARLALLGFEANISERQSDNGVLYRVRIGPFSQQEIMNRIRSKLTDSGVDAAVVRTAK